jgi:fucose permease
MFGNAFLSRKTESAQLAVTNGINTQTLPRMPTLAKSPRANHLPLNLAFLLTGVATALLGAALPVMLKEWHLTDTTGGSLLLLAWGGSTCGALLFRGNLRRSSAAGLLVTALSMLALAALDRSAALPLFAFYGLGLGIAMTAITLLSSQGASETARNRIMMRLNLLWSIGACVAPTLATHALTHTRVGSLFTTMGLVFCAAAIAVSFSGKETTANTAADNTSHLKIAPLALYAVAFLAVGVESAIGGWLTTYAGRTAHTELITISATSAFWVGLLLSRALHSVSTMRWLQSAPALIAHAAIAALASATLLAAPHSAAFLPSALLAGFGLGPLYPRVLAMVVGTYKPRAIFIVAGVGSAAMPWLTGTLSHAAGSLGFGMLVPCAGAAALLLMMLSRPHTAAI